MAVDQIIYISSTVSSNAGGYYRVIAKNINGDLAAVNVIRLSWVVPNVTFVVNPNSVLAGSAITPAGTIGTPGTPGGNGAAGRAGINAFSPLTTSFIQPPVNTNVTIFTPNTAWIGIGQILYIASDGTLGGIGGFYQLVSKTTTQIIVTRLDWTIPNITFVVANGTNIVPANSYIIPSGAKGADGITSALSYILGSQWGSYPSTISGLQKLTSIQVPLNTLITNYDALECQTIFRLNGNSATTNTYRIIVSPSDNTTGTDVINLEYWPGDGIEDFVFIHMNYKIQRISATQFRCKGEIFFSIDSPIPIGGTTIPEVDKSFVNVSTSNLTLSGTWASNQWIVAEADDLFSAGSAISVIHHEVKVTKKI